MKRERPARKLRRMGGSQGFLLAEALVTMAIGAFLLVALVSLVHLLTRADARTVELSRRIEAESRALDAIGRDLRPVSRTRWGGAGAPFVFAGTDRRMQFAVRDAGMPAWYLQLLRSSPELCRQRPTNRSRSPSNSAPSWIHQFEGDRLSNMKQPNTTITLLER